MTITQVNSDQVSFIATGTGAVDRDLAGKLAESVSVKDYGAVGDGVTDDTAAIQAALDYGATQEACTVEFTGGPYKLNSGISIDASKITIRGNGVLIDNTGMTTGSAITFFTSETDGNLLSIRNAAKYVEGLYFRGPGISVTAVSLFTFTTSPWSAAILVRNGGATGYYRGEVYLSGTFFVTFRDFFWNRLDASNDVDTVIYIPAGLTVFGEKIVHDNCSFINLAGTVVDASTYCDLYFTNCSFDYCDKFVTAKSGAHIELLSCHIESDKDVDFWFEVTALGAGDTDTLIRIQGGELLVTGNKSAFQIGTVNSICTNGGIELLNVKFLPGVNTYSLSEMITGGGRVFAKNMSFSASGVKPIISNQINLFPWSGTFENANSLAPLTLTGSTPPARSNANPRTGSWALRITGASGDSPVMQWPTPIIPGQFAQLECWVSIQNITGTGGTAYISLDFVDGANNVVQSINNMAVTTNAATYALKKLPGQIPCPVGASFVRVFANIFGTTSGAPTMDVDDLVMNVS